MNNVIPFPTAESLDKKIEEYRQEAVNLSVQRDELNFIYYRQLWIDYNEKILSKTIENMKIAFQDHYLRSCFDYAVSRLDRKRAYEISLEGVFKEEYELNCLNADNSLISGATLTDNASYTKASERVKKEAKQLFTRITAYLQPEINPNCLDRIRFFESARQAYSCANLTQLKKIDDMTTPQLIKKAETLKEKKDEIDRLKALIEHFHDDIEDLLDPYDCEYKDIMEDEELFEETVESLLCEKEELEKRLQRTKQLIQKHIYGESEEEQ
ncbi:MAG: hypothetical protein IJS61_08285 [Firmicutes bacterium]|nr:hypothetical protein [Bacillota bacterium]